MILNQHINEVLPQPFSVAEQQTPAEPGDTPEPPQPRGRPWVKGQSGNPRGRPSRARQAACVAEALIGRKTVPLTNQVHRAGAGRRPRPVARLPRPHRPGAARAADRSRSAGHRKPRRSARRADGDCRRRRVGCADRTAKRRVDEDADRAPPGDVVTPAETRPSPPPGSQGRRGTYRYRPGIAGGTVSAIVLRASSFST
jgi:hypothetical protein